jgi:hypothetical protein
MYKTFHITLPLSKKDSYELVCKSGDEIRSWQRQGFDAESGYVEWLQKFWSLTGTTGITVRLEEVSEQETSATVLIHKPMQIFDPVQICYRVFRKLERGCQKNLENILAQGKRHDQPD